MKLFMRLVVSLVLVITEKRLGKRHRHEESWQYRLFNTTLANLQADRIAMSLGRRTP